MDTNKSLKDMAAMTPRRSSRLLHTHTPKLSDRKKGLFQSVVDPPRESLTTHRKLPVVDSDSDSEDCDLGIISTLDSSSDENDHNTPRTPDRTLWHETRNQTRKFLKENHDLKNFIKSPFTLKKYQNRYPYPETRCTGSVSTPVTPHLHNPPGTPSSTHSCASAHTTSSTSSRARKSLASLIADTESCSSSLKDLNFDTDSGTDSKENTPTKFLRQSNRTLKLTPKFHSFKGILREQKKNVSPITGDRTAVVSLTKMDMSSMISPTQMQKTPQNTTEVDSPPRISHRRSAIEIAESPESACDSEKSHKRLRNESVTENEPISKYARLENAPKARLSLFNSDRLKEILSTKSFYGKPNPVLNPSVTAKISNAIEVSTNHHRKPFHSQTSRRKRRPGQINLGVRHKIRKPKHTKNNIIVKYNTGKASSSTANNSTANSSMLNSSVTSATNDASMISQNSSQELGNDKHDLFDKEKQTIEALLSQWEEEDVPEAELTYSKAKEIPCFSSSVIEETHQIFQPVTAVQVTSAPMPQDNGAVIVELGGEMTSLPQNGTCLPQTDQQAMNNLTTRIQESTMTMAQNGTTMSQNETTMAQNGTTMAQNGTTMSQNETTMAQNGSNMSQNGTTMAQNGTTMAQNGTTTEQNGMTMSTVTDGLQDVLMTDALDSHEANHGSAKTAQFLPVEGGYILVEENGIPDQEVLPDLDEIDRELKMLDEQILKMAQTNNINAEAVLASTDIAVHDAATKSSTDACDDEKAKLFPIFSNPNPGESAPTAKDDKSSKKPLIKTGVDQYVIDAGQKKFGATQCAQCGTIYQIGDPQDEHDHLVHHNATDVLRFNGWKEECVIERSDSWRCIRVRGGESNWRRVEALLSRLVHPQLGYEGPLTNKNIRSMTAYLCIVKKTIVGCLIAETKTKAYKLIPGEPDCCSVEDYPVKCGISRLWTHINHRRCGVARRLLDCARASFLYGEALRVEHVAFSAPTAAGKAFAARYCGTHNFYVYID